MATSNVVLVQYQTLGIPGPATDYFVLDAIGIGSMMSGNANMSLSASFYMTTLIVRPL